MVRRRKDWAFFTVKNVESTHFFVVIFVIAWKESRNRKSLVIEGARQAGKTWMMKGFGCRANRDHMLLIFAEVQEVPRALFSPKYFYENAPQYHIVCAGSLLGIALHSSTSFPVGKVEFLKMAPDYFE